MSKVVKRASPGRRILGALTGLVIGGTAVLAPTAANAAPGPTAPGDGRDIGKVAPRPQKRPPNARPADRPMPRPGAHGPVFQDPRVGARSATSDGVTPQVVGGDPANIADHPYVVGLQTWYQDGGDWYISYCTGTIVGRKKVLTAGHCTVDFLFGTTFVIAGRNNLDADTGGFVARVDSTWTHQGYNYAAFTNGTAPAPVDDVAVLTLKDALPSAYPNVTLSAQGDQSPYAAGTQAVVVGYGTSSSALADFGTLRKATIPIQSDATCTAALPGYDSSRMTCAGDPANGVDSCGGDSGGPLLVNGRQVGITDWGYEPCGSNYGVYERLSRYASSVSADLTRPDVVNLDWSGDGHSDLFGRDSSGQLHEFSGSGLASDGRGGFAGSGISASGFGGFTKLFRVTNWNGDGNPSIMARASDGRLYQYRSNGSGAIDVNPVQVGTGWNMFSDIMVTNNWTGNGRPNVMGRTPTGDLYLYTSDGNGGWLNGGIGQKIGTGWNTFDTVLTPGTWSGDGYQALIGRKSNGDLMLYKSDGNGGWLNGGIGVRIGTGWGIFSIFMSPGDWNGDRQVDLVGRNAAGELMLYRTDGYGNWLNGGMGQRIGSGWNAFNTVF